MKNNKLLEELDYIIAGIPKMKRIRMAKRAIRQKNYSVVNVLIKMEDMDSKEIEEILTLNR